MGRKKKRVRPAGASHVVSEEGLGLVLLAATVYLALSLGSYDPADGDLFIQLASGSPNNMGGRVGATIAALSYQLVGLGAWLGVLTLASVGVSRVRGRTIPAPVTKTLGLATLLLFGCILAHYGLGDVRLAGSSMPAGGLLGSWGGAALGAAFGPVGAPLVAVTVALLALVAVTKLSIARVCHALWDLLGAMHRRAITAFARWRERRRKARQHQTVIAKYSERRARDREEAREAATESPVGERRRGPVLTLKVPVKTTRPGAPAPEEAEPVAAASTPEPDPEPDEPAELPFEQPAGPDGTFAVPDLELLTRPGAEHAIDQKELMEKAKAITSKAAEFKVTGEVVAIHPGPVVTTFEFRPGSGVKYSKITNLQDDLSLALKAETIRISRMRGKATVGIEVPNKNRVTIRLREVLESRAFQSSKSKLTLAVGKQIHGENMVTDLSRMPHLLIAGTTGSGKSVALNSMLLSLLYKATPDEVKLVLIDPKRLEFGLYEDIPHLLTDVVVEPKLAANALSWAVREMERRYKLLAEYGVRNIDQFNLILKRGGERMAGDDDEDEPPKPLPWVVVIIDELSDLMMTASNVVEEAIIRLSQMARAVGIHLILATQRPSVDVITGVIKNNLPARMSFRVASKVDSRVILDTQGAESLLGKGDMLFLAPGTSRITRLHGAFVDEQEVKRVVSFWRSQGRPAYHEDVTAPPPSDSGDGLGNDDGERDEFFEDAVRVVLAAGEASVSNIQRKLSVGYARAGRIMDSMEAEGIVGPAQGTKPRKVLVDSTVFDEL